MKPTNQSYHWQGINKQGINLQGVIEAASMTLAKKELNSQAILVRTIKRNSYALFGTKITASLISLFFRQLATMLNAGIPIIQSFNFVAQSQDNLRMKRLIEIIKIELEQGLALSEALERRPHYFNALVCNLIATGEKSGKLDLMLAKVASYKEKMESVKRKLKKALTYPLLVLVIASFVTIALLVYVVPQFETIFKSFNAELPALTQIFIYLSHLIKNYCLELFIPVFLCLIGFKLTLKHSTTINYLNDRLILKIPLWGSLISKVIIARFAQTLAISFSSGIPLLESLNAVAGVTGNRVYVLATEQIQNALLAGDPLHSAMKNTGLFPNLVVQMIAIGEESGTLEVMLNKVAELYEEEFNLGLDISINLLEPIIMSLLGLIIGSLVIAMYLPIFKLGSVI
ncbi:MAG: type II secretion system F family protein [Tatlockia sp.]|nr:type II secretion system F family protein [Tatlockia sp.]